MPAFKICFLAWQAQKHSAHKGRGHRPVSGKILIVSKMLKIITIKTGFLMHDFFGIKKKPALENLVNGATGPGGKGFQ